jgi:hypothetical protein
VFCVPFFSQALQAYLGLTCLITLKLSWDDFDLPALVFTHLMQGTIVASTDFIFFSHVIYHDLTGQNFRQQFKLRLRLA